MGKGGKVSRLSRRRVPHWSATNSSGSVGGGGNKPASQKKGEKKGGDVPGPAPNFTFATKRKEKGKRQRNPIWFKTVEKKG